MFIALSQESTSANACKLKKDEWQGRMKGKRCLLGYVRVSLNAFQLKFIFKEFGASTFSSISVPKRTTHKTP